MVRRHAGLTGYLSAESLASLTFAMFPVLFIAFVVDVLSGDEATVGIIRGTAAFGGLAAAVIVGRIGDRAKPAHLMVWGYIGLGAVALVFVNITAITTALWVFLLLFALSGFPNVTSQIGATTTAQRLCPPAALGRLQGLLSAATSAGAIVGSIGVGLMIDYIDVKSPAQRARDPLHTQWSHRVPRHRSSHSTQPSRPRSSLARVADAYFAVSPPSSFCAGSSCIPASKWSSARLICRRLVSGRSWVKATTTAPVHSA